MADTQVPQTLPQDLNDGGHNPFQEILRLPPSLIPTATNFTSLLRHFVKIDEGGISSFDWTSFKDTAKAQGLQVANVVENKEFILLEYQSVVALAEEVVNYIKETFSAEVTGLKDEIVYVLTNLKECEKKGFASFYRNNEKKATGFRFNALFATTKKKDSDNFYGLVLTIKVEAEEKDVSWWWDLEKENEERFGCTVNGMEIIIGNEFRFTAKSLSAGGS